MPENQKDKSPQHARVYAWLLIRANRDTHTHIHTCAHIYTREMLLPGCKKEREQITYTKRQICNNFKITSKTKE